MSQSDQKAQETTGSALVIHWLGARGSRAANRIWQADDQKTEIALLRPLAAAFGALTRARRSAYARGVLRSERANIPVISVGNLTVGGTGKTPFTRWLAERLIELGQKPAILHRGYGSDEPELHRQWHPDVPVLVGGDRVESVRQAQQAGATVVVLDDGLQHLRLARDLDLVLVSADHWDQPRRLLPAGRWREPISVLQDVSGIIVTRKAADRTQARSVAKELRQEAPRAVSAVASIQPLDFVRLTDGQKIDRALGDVAALCAIADPAAFADQLGQTGMRVTDLYAFDDHHEYTGTDLQLVRARAHGRTIVTTEKDAVKLRRIDPTLEAIVVRQKVTIEEGENDLLAAVRSVLR
jgi:tetraacyldisaccharide 4'-kinase